MSNHANVYAGAEGVAASKCHEQAIRRLELHGWTSTVHDHKHDQSCNENCKSYLVPSEEAQVRQALDWLETNDA